MAKYIPPKQGKLSQVFDVLVLLVLTVGSLYIPLWLKLAGGAKTPAAPDPAATWASLGQDTPEKIAGWNALGYTDPTNTDLQAMITARYDYWDFSRWEMLLMVVIVVGYFVIVVRFSDTEYREVIDEKFGSRNLGG
jgi:hypothetical protein